MHSLRSEAASLWRSRRLLWVLVRREVAARYTGTAAGVLWLYAQPLATLAAYFLVFDLVLGMRLGAGAPTSSVGAFLVVGALPWMAWSDAVQRSMGSLLEAGALLQKNALPPVLFPVRAVLASQLVYAPLLLLLALVYIPWHGGASALWLLLPILLLMLLVMVLLGYVLAVLALALRDVVQLVGFALSPVTPVVLACQSVLLQGQVPPWQVWPALLGWVVVLAAVLAVLVRRSRDQWVDWL